MRVVFLLAVLAATSAAAPKAKDEPRPLPPVDPAVQATLDQIEKGPDRAGPIDTLMKNAPSEVDSLGTFLARTHTASIEDRRKVLFALTEAGRSAMDAARRHRRDWLNGRVAELTVEERAAIARVTPLLLRIADS